MTSQPIENQFIVRVAETAAERELCYMLRYRVYVEEFQCKVPTADHQRKQDWTKDDDTATLYYASLGDEIVGTIRIHHGADTDIPIAFYQTCDLQRFLADTPLEQMMAVGRLAIDASHRGGKATVALIQGCFSSVLDNHPDTRLVFILALDEPRLTAMYRMLGFRPVGQKTYLYDLGQTLPMFLYISDSMRK